MYHGRLWPGTKRVPVIKRRNMTHPILIMHFSLISLGCILEIRNGFEEVDPVELAAVVSVP